MDVLKRFDRIADCLPEGCKQAEVEIEKCTHLSAHVTDQHLAGGHASSLTECYVRASGNQTGMVYSQKLDEDPTRLIRMAYENSLYAQQKTPEPMHDAVSGGADILESELSHSLQADLSEKALELDQAIRDHADDIRHSSTTLVETINSRGIINTKGLHKTCSRRMVEATIVLSREAGQDHYLFNSELSACSISDLRTGVIIQQIDRWRSSQLARMPLAGGRYQAVLDASVVCNILATAWQMFSAPLCLAGNSPLARLFGERVFAEKVSIRDLPVTNDSGYDFPLDCEGSNGAAVDLVNRGVLTGLLQTLSSARTLDMAATGNAGRKNLMSGNVHTQVTAIPKNLKLLPGQRTLEELIRSMDNGIYVFESYDVFHSINVASGSFSIPCKAIVVQDGRKIGVAEGLTISGDITSLLGDVTDIANDSRVLPMVMLKSYTVGAPSLMVSAIQVNG